MNDEAPEPASEPEQDTEATNQSNDPPPFDGPVSTGASLLELLKDGPFWEGDDLEECLAIVYATRGVWYP